MFNNMNGCNNRQEWKDMKAWHEKDSKSKNIYSVLSQDQLIYRAHFTHIFVTEYLTDNMRRILTRIIK